jgi:hypothetical protein
MRGPNNGGLQRGEYIAPLKAAKNVPHLCRDDGPVEFNSHESAKKVADRVGGVAYKSSGHAHYLVKFEQ